MTWLPRLFALAAFAAIVTPAEASPDFIQYDFWGVVVNGDPSWAPQDSRFKGYFRYDATTPQSAPYEWRLTTARLHIEFAHLTIDTVGSTDAESLFNHESITFQNWVNPTLLPFPVETEAHIDIRFETYRDDYFTKLPTTETPGDHSLFFYIDDNLVVGTDTAFNPTVPEPATAALVLAGLMGLGLRRRWRMR